MMDHGQEDVFLSCPVCEQLTDSLKQYRYMQWCVFLLAGVIYRHTDVRACPGCMRAFVRRSLLINVVPANLVWLVGLLPWGLILLALSYRKGHSKGVLQAVEAEATLARSPAAMDSPFASREVLTAQGDEVSWYRVTAVLALLLCWLPVLGLITGAAAVVLNHRGQGWQKVCSWVGLAVSGVLHLALLAIMLVAALS
jgi:hypothetical protein